MLIKRVGKQVCVFSNETQIIRQKIMSSLKVVSLHAHTTLLKFFDPIQIIRSVEFFETDVSLSDNFMVGAKFLVMFFIKFFILKKIFLANALIYFLNRC